MNIAIILDWTMAIMLIISITYSWRLNKKIMDFKSNKGEFFQLIRILDETIVRAENNIEELKRLSVLTSNNLGSKLDVAKIVLDDLGFLSDRASTLNDKLESSVKIAKKYEVFFKNQATSNQDNKNYSPSNFAPPSYIASSSEENNKSQEPKAAAIESLLAKISALRSKKEVVDN